jgi:hypothetical protein
MVLHNNEIINTIHIILVVIIAFTPIVKSCLLKELVLILLIFVSIHYITRYGKCGLINIERYFLGDNFKNGIVYRLIKPVISYKNNFFYKNLFWLIIIYIFIIYFQLNKNCKSIFNSNIIKQIKLKYF